MRTPWGAYSGGKRMPAWERVVHLTSAAAPGELVGDFELLGGVQRYARGLLTVPESRVENQYLAAVHRVIPFLRSVLPCFFVVARGCAAAEAACVWQVAKPCP
jgi:hypothetical protein